MCGRFAQEMLDREYCRFMREVMKAEPPEPKPRYNIAPQQKSLVVRITDGAVTWDELRWGFRPSWLKDKNRAQINARAESVFESRMFRHSAEIRRCVVPATGWYEWQVLTGGKQPFYIHRKDGSTFGFAGIWTTWHGEDDKDEANYAIITTEANQLVAPIHKRMPVVLDESDYGAWLDPMNHDAKNLSRFLVPYKGKNLEAYPVSTYVNAPKNTSEECVKRMS